MKTTEKNVFFAPSLCSIFLHFCSIFSQRVTLVTAKNQHRCWKACRCAYAWRILLRSFCKVEVTNSARQEMECHFSAIFFLFGAISTHILIGAQRNIALSYFYSGNQLTDKTDDANLTSQRHTAFYHFLTFHCPSHLCSDAPFFAQQTDADYVANPQKGSTNRKTKTGTIHEGQFQQQKEVFTLCNFKT